jgi:phage antirepressor YoqD-like protein
MFDPFCRCKRIQFHEFETTVGQLNFFQWAIQDDVLDYIEQHHSEIQSDMELRLHETKEDTTSKKRHELSASATKSLKYHNVAVTVKFD